jgi:hypothetical protein
MYRKTILIVAILVCAIVLAATYLSGQAHRYDIVAVGAGGGGSNEDKGDITTEEYLIDHKTGEVWQIEYRMFIPITKVNKDGKLPGK